MVKAARIIWAEVWVVTATTMIALEEVTTSINSTNRAATISITRISVKISASKTEVLQVVTKIIWVEARITFKTRESLSKKASKRTFQNHSSLLARNMISTKEAIIKADHLTINIRIADKINLVVILLYHVQISRSLPHQQILKVFIKKGYNNHSEQMDNPRT